MAATLPTSGYLPHGPAEAPRHSAHGLSSSTEVIRGHGPTGHQENLSMTAGSGLPVSRAWRLRRTCGHHGEAVESVCGLVVLFHAGSSRPVLERAST